MKEIAKLPNISVGCILPIFTGGAAVQAMNALRKTNNLYH